MKHTCLCGERAFKIKLAGWVCHRCDEIEKKNRWMFVKDSLKEFSQGNKDKNKRAREILRISQEEEMNLDRYSAGGLF